MLLGGNLPGRKISSEKSASDRSAKGNQSMRRLPDQAANAAIQAKTTVFEARYRRIQGRDPKKYNQAIWAVAKNICGVILEGPTRRRELRGTGRKRSNPRADKRRATRLLRELKALGYQVQVARLPAAGRFSSAPPMASRSARLPGPPSSAP
jgi:hypothetical protein